MMYSAQVPRGRRDRAMRGTRGLGFSTRRCVNWKPCMQYAHWRRKTTTTRRHQLKKNKNTGRSGTQNSAPWSAVVGDPCTYCRYSYYWCYGTAEEFAVISKPSRLNWGVKGQGEKNCYNGRNSLKRGARVENENGSSVAAHPSLQVY